MILSEKINVKITGKNIEHYKSFGYETSNKILEVSPEHLTIGSHILIYVKCDICNKEREIQYKEYLHSCKNHNYYACSSKCAQNKNKLTNFDKYGVEYVTQSKDVQKQIKITNLEKYGVEYSSQSKEIREKTKQTMLDKYGVENPSQVKEFQEKRRNTMFGKFGVEYYVLATDFKEKCEKTCITNWGESHPSKSKIYKDSRGFNIIDNEFERYKMNVYNLTKHNKKQLLENWNGYDYYDGEYILDNYQLNGSDGDYPTIDHKTSIKEGFLNNIPEEILADVANLCITKRKVNSSKHTSNEKDYKNR